MRVQNIYADESIRILLRLARGVETASVPKYFEYDLTTQQSTGREFKSRSQVVSYLKKLGKI